jgi:cell division septal protein FtsQ
MLSIRKKGEEAVKPYKYYRSGVAPSKEETKKPKKPSRGIYGRLVDTALILLILAGGIYCLMLTSPPRTKVNSTLYHSQSDYEAAITHQFAPVLNKNKITLKQNEIESNLKKQYPEISNVNIKLPVFSHQPTVDLTIAAPTFKLNSAEQTYIINSEGVIISKADNLHNQLFLATINDQSGYINKVGDKVLSTQSIEFIKDIITQCKVSNISIESLTIPPVAQELYLKTTGSKYYLKFFLGGNSAQQLGQFLAARKYYAKTHHDPKQYLDVRVEGKIFYK